MTCILCGQPNNLLFSARDYRRPHDRTEHLLYWCGSCSIGRLAGRFTAAEVQAFYSGPYYTHGDQTTQREHRSVLQKALTHLAWRLDKGHHLKPAEIQGIAPHGSAFCEIGCGNGYHLRAFKSAGYAVTGVEPDPLARAAAEEICPIFDGTAEDIPAELLSRMFDVVLIHHVLEHCIDPIKALANAAKLLAPKGLLLIEVPNSSARGFSTFGALWPFTDIPRHLNFFTERSLIQALSHAGFTAIKINYVGYTRQFMLPWLQTQEDIWANIGSGKKPNFTIEAWRLLLRTALAPARLKYDSIRIHAKRG